MPRLLHNSAYVTKEQALEVRRHLRSASDELKAALRVKTDTNAGVAIPGRVKTIILKIEIMICDVESDIWSMLSQSEQNKFGFILKDND